MNGRTTPPRGPWSRGPGGFGLPPLTPAPTDLVVLLAVVFVTYSLQFFSTTAIVPGLLRLTPLVWRAGFVWQLATYPFSGYGPVSILILLDLLVLYWFGRDVFYQLGRRRFWQTVLTSAVVAALVAVVVELVVELVAGPEPAVVPFALMQGQRVLLTITIAAFATLNRDATILLFFVLPIRPRWFLWMEILIAFIFFLGTKDLAGFAGIVTAVGVTYASLVAGGPRRMLREWWLRLQRRRLQAELDRRRRKSKLEVLDGGRGRSQPPRQGPWVN